MDLKALFELTFLGSQFFSADEPALFKKVREKVSIWSSSYGGAFLNWEKIRSVVGDTDQMTVTYLLVSPDHGMLQDIEGIAQIYNPENTWKRQNFDELIIEIGRLGWDEQIIETHNGRRWLFPKVNADNIEQLGYLTFRIPIFH